MNTFSRKDTKFVKGIAILLMFYHHLFTSFEDYLEGVEFRYTIGLFHIPMNFYIGVFGKICIALFVFLSGYGTYISLKKSDNISKTLGQKILRIYKQHWRALIVFIPVCLIVGSSNVKNLNVVTLIKNFTAIEMTICTSVAFLTPFLILLVFTPIILFFSDKVKNVFTSCVIVVISAIFGLYVLPQLPNTVLGANLNSSPLYSLLVNPLILLLPQYLGGIVCAKYDLISKVKDKYQDNPIAAVVAAAVVVLVVIFRWSNGIEYDFIYAPLFTIAIVVVFENKLGRIIRKPIEKIGEHSTLMWMTHPYYWLYCFQRFIFAPYYSVLICLLLVVVTYATSVVITFVFDKFELGVAKLSGILTPKRNAEE